MAVADVSSLAADKILTPDSQRFAKSDTSEKPDFQRHIVPLRNNGNRAVESLIPQRPTRTGWTATRSVVTCDPLSPIGIGVLLYLDKGTFSFTNHNLCVNNCQKHVKIVNLLRFVHAFYATTIHILAEKTLVLLVCIDLVASKSTLASHKLALVTQKLALVTHKLAFVIHKLAFVTQKLALVTQKLALVILKLVLVAPQMTLVNS